MILRNTPLPPMPGNDADALPDSVKNYLERFQTRKRRAILLRGVGLSALFAICWLLICCFADRFLHLRGFVRLPLLVLNVIGTLFIVIRAIREARPARTGLVSAAAEIEIRTDRFNQRLATVTSQLLGRAEVRGSVQMLRAILDDLEPDLRDGDPASLIPTAPVTRPWIGLAAILLISAVLVGFVGGSARRLIARELFPWVRIPPVTTTTLHVIPGDAEIPEGQRLVIRVFASRIGDDLPLLSISNDGQTWEHQPMNPSGEGSSISNFSSTNARAPQTAPAPVLQSFDLDLGPLDRDVKYSVSAGDATTPVYSIRMLYQPVVESFRFAISYPEYIHSSYTKEHPLVIDRQDGSFESPAGSNVTITVRSNEALESASLSVGSTGIPMKQGGQPNEWQCNFRVIGDVPMFLRMLSSRKVQGRGPANMAVHAIADLPPSIEFLEPKSDLRETMYATPSIAWLATDDYGVTGVSLRIKINDQPAEDIPATTQSESRYLKRSMPLDLSMFDLKNGDVVRVQLVARDGAGHEETSRQARNILISSHPTDENGEIRYRELQRASELAGILASDTNKNNFLLAHAEAVEAAEQLTQALLRADTRANTHELATANAHWLDDAARLSRGIERAGVHPDVTDRGLASLPSRASQLQKDLETVARGQRAMNLLNEKTDLDSHKKLPADVKKRIDSQMTEDAKSIGLDPSSEDFANQLTQAADAGRQTIDAQPVVDFAKIAQAWSDRLPRSPKSQTDLDARLDIAARAEALRPDSNMARARDLNLEAQVAGKIAEGSRSIPREQFPAAIDATEKEFEATKPSAAPDPNAAQTSANAEAARKKLAQWAAATDAGTQPPIAVPEDQTLAQALQANANSAVKKKPDTNRSSTANDSATQPSRTSSPTTRTEAAVKDQSPTSQPQSAENAPDPQEVAQTIDDLLQQQNRIASETAQATSPQQKQSVAEEQAKMSSDIQNLAERNEPQSPRASAAQQKAMDAVSSAGGRLERLSKNLQNLKQAMDNQQAADKSLQDAKAAEASAAMANNPAAQAASAATVAQAQKRSQNAAAQADAARQAVNADSPSDISQSLKAASPQSNAARKTLDQNLAPTMKGLQSPPTDSTGFARAAQQIADAQAATNAATQQLKQALGRLIHETPLSSATDFSQAAASDLKQGNPNPQSTATNQNNVSAALAQARISQLRKAATARLARVPSLAPVFGQLPNVLNLAGSDAGPDASIDNSAVRQWGDLQQRDQGQLNSPDQELSAPTYSQALQAYFDALNQPGEQK